MIATSKRHVLVFLLTASAVMGSGAHSRSSQLIMALAGINHRPINQKLFQPQPLLLLRQSPQLLAKLSKGGITLATIFQMADSWSIPRWTALSSAKNEVTVNILR
jgi:hypothetical protein